MARFKYSGRIPPGSLRHDPTLLAGGEIIAPTIITPPNPAWGKVGQYGATVVGASPPRYDPSGDCGGSFMSFKNQTNNNCYAYGVDIASNSFSQPGRASAGSTPWSMKMTADSVAANAVLDGLVLLPQKTIADLIDKSGHVQGSAGHFVALVFSPPEKSFTGDPNAHWGGDYHWVRADAVDTKSKIILWSQKDGGDQVTNFDFAGKPISDPAAACWEVNQGAVSSSDPNDMIISYVFHAYMWVPSSGVKIL
jgi:hypothetical protein